jgi:hypothetical protein
MTRKQHASASSAHGAGKGHIDVNGLDRGLVLDASGGEGNKLNDSAGQPVDSQNISGDGVSASDSSPGSALQTKMSAKAKQRSLRQKIIAQSLAQNLSTRDLIMERRPEDQSGGCNAQTSDTIPTQPDFTNSAGEKIDMTKFSFDREESRREALAYLQSDAVQAYFRFHNCDDARQAMIADVQAMTAPGKNLVDRGSTPIASKTCDSTQQRRRVAPTPISEAARLGSNYRVGDPTDAGSIIGQHGGIIGLLAAKQKENRAHVNRELASRAAGVIPETPAIGCQPKDAYELALLTDTVSRVVQRRGDLLSLPRKDFLRKATSMALREIHKQEMKRSQRPPPAEVDEDKGGSDAESVSSRSSTPSSISKNDGDSESLGDTCSSGRSGSEGSYDKRDKFVKDDDKSSRDTTDSESESGLQSKLRLKSRLGAMNSLGSPKKPKGQSGAQAPPAGSGLMVFGGDDDLKMWTIGTAKFKQGLNWESYLHHKQAFDNHMQHKGKWSERTFKSIIHANLVPVVCATCGFRRSRWHLIEDAQLIIKLEKALRPSRSTDFAMELRALKLFRNTGDALIVRYQAFAEKFICKCAEAEDAGKRIKPNVIKAAFRNEVERESVLKHWLQEVRWTGVERAHKRLLRKLREARSIEQLFSNGNTGRGDDADDDEGSEREGRKKPKRRIVVKKSGRFNGTKTSASKKRKGRSNHTDGARARPAAPAKGDKGQKLRKWNYDQRGASWHTDHDLYECYDKPCQKEFCQRCRCHGHTAEYCRKPDDAPGLTREGYAQENAKGKAALRAPPPPRVGKNNKARGASRYEEHQSSSDGEGCSHKRSRSNYARQSSKSCQHSGSDEDEHRENGRGNAVRATHRNCL